jgi:LysR family transcriptional regulator (chromosome initiation inhibitor)
VRAHLQDGQLVNIAPSFALPIELYWHCWNLDSVVLDGLTDALTSAAAVSLVRP